MPATASTAFPSEKVVMLGKNHEAILKIVMDPIFK